LNGCLGFRTMRIDGLLCGIVKTFHYFKVFYYYYYLLGKPAFLFMMNNLQCF
jgi:hypothetical protein